MHIVCTHEQADFDAIASLIGVALLDRQAIPVLPRRVNHNVQAFLNLYSADLPFTRFDDLPRGLLTQITLVDTQSLPSVKGFQDDTRVHVIDHHPVDPGMPSAWSKHLDMVGASATLLVEQLLRTANPAGALESSLLLLGIYEDTGSLTYASTTARDVHACGWLLEQGASLSLVHDFLEHPLTNGQRELYKRLVEAAHSYTIGGLSIIVAGGEAQGLAEEVSTLAHMLRDLYDPDGLFVIVELDGFVQLVARSTTNALDVGRVAAHFGGGGHQRAAASLIRKKTVAEVQEELLRVLESVIEPARSVADIMSRDPQLLDPGVRIDEAAERMQRFGHEGYPVVRAGKVLGLLTRRAVDRAVTHGMGNQPIVKIMKAGEIFIGGQDSVNQLQDLMIEHGWGQVPVIDTNTGDIIGIVTRTDLISALGPNFEDKRVSDYLETLSAALPIPRLNLLMQIAEQAEVRRDALYVVGGFVRDLLLGSPSVDFDLVVEGDAIGLAQELANLLGGRVSSHRRFGTAKWQLSSHDPRLIDALGISSGDGLELPQSLDFVTARTEFYAHPTALPSIEHGSIKLDLHRRDFTINTLAMRLDKPFQGQLLDYWGGGRDLSEKQIRILHSLSFIDDPTRILRAIRLEQRLGFSIEDRTMELLSEAVVLLERVSGERIRSELDAILDEPLFEAMLGRLKDLGVLTAIHEALTWDAWLSEKFSVVRAFSRPKAWLPADSPEMIHLFYGLWLIRLDPQHIDTAASRLRLPGTLKADILDAHRMFEFLSSLPPEVKISDIVERLDDFRQAGIITVYLAAGPGSDIQVLIDDYLSRWSQVQPKTTGDDLREIGLPPGPRYRQILRRLRAAWLDGVISTPDEEKTLRGKLLHDDQLDA